MGRRSASRLVVVAAALIAVAAACSEPTDSVRSDTATTTPPTASPTSATTPSTTPPPTTQPSADGVQTIVFDASNPPPLIVPDQFVTIERAANPDARPVTVTANEQHIIVKQPGTDQIEMIGRAGAESRTIDFFTETWAMVAGPDGVVYAIFEDYGSQVEFPAYQWGAVSTSGDREGDLLAGAALQRDDFLDLPPGVFGTGRHGIVDRSIDGTRPIMDYVSAAGDAVELAAASIPPDVTIEERGDDRLISVAVPPTAWLLDIQRTPDITTAHVEYPQAPSSRGRVVYAERIGPPPPGGQNGIFTLPVIAILNPDGTGSAVRLPDEWSVVSSDVFGTVLMRVNETTIDFAMLDDVLGVGATPPIATDAPLTTVPPFSGPGELIIENSCPNGLACATQLLMAEDGRLIAFDWSSWATQIFDAAGRELLDTILQIAPDGEDPVAEAVGPDDVLYVSYLPADGQGQRRDLVAIPLTGPNAGQVVQTWTGLERSGDSVLVPTADGLVAVTCCAPLAVQPDPAAITYEWVDRIGAVITSDRPTFTLDLIEGELIRTEFGTTMRFPLPTVSESARIMHPEIVATDDGGALMHLTSVGISPHDYIVRFAVEPSESGIGATTVYLLDDTEFGNDITMESAGTVIVRTDTGFVRRTLDEIGTPGWTGTLTTNLDGPDWTATPVGLNEFVATEQPAWAFDPYSLGYELVPRVGPGAGFGFSFNESTGLLTVTIDGLRDDSVDAEQYEFVLERDNADGPFRVVSGTYAVRCAPGRGQRDFAPQICI